MSEKDEDLLKKVSLIASAIKIDPPPILAADVTIDIPLTNYIRLTSNT